MRFTVKFVCAGVVLFPLAVWAQPLQPFPIGSPQSCVNLPNHAAIQDCQTKQKAQGQEWEKEMKDRYRYPSPPPKLNGADDKLPMNCFKRESTGEKICAN
ncbi:hypothetical protein [Limnohabitans sp. B9-3]|uniref:hypothetical protein n=1 Tax=Limnohabitans sp. B9-3 TaxID=1100707 RepID=UPI000C1EDA70|nr:hypothetical protein [Limnohabitans sp. B9-3]PIT71659.1 hypothetical protein B9Z42_14415 [Limnohabitans sp. B9-3]